MRLFVVVATLTLLGGCDKLLGIQDRELAPDARGSDDLPPLRLRITAPQLPKLGERPPGTLPPVTVEVIDPDDKVVEDATAPIFLRLITDDAAVMLTGTTNATPSNGKVTFDNLEINRPGGNLRIEASTQGAPKVLSDVFSISSLEVLETFRGSTTLAFTQSIGFSIFARAADVDGDDDLDLLGSGFGFEQMRNTVAIARNNGDGTFGSFSYEATSATSATPDAELAIATGDLDGDGDIDLAVTTVAEDSITLLVNDGAGGYATRAIPVCDRPIAVVAVDLDADDRVDLVLTCSGADSVGFLRNITSPGDEPAFAARQDFPNQLGGCGHNVALGDLNRDGRVDVITPGFCGNVGILRGAASTTLATAQAFPIGGHNRNVEVIDLDEDGDLDLVSGGGFGNPAGNPLSYRLNQTAIGATNLSFAAPVNVAAPVVSNGRHIVVAVDLDADGRRDLASVFQGSPDLLVFPNAGGSPVTFDPPLKVPLEHPAHWLDRADLDGDGREDLVVGAVDGLMVLFTKQ